MIEAINKYLSHELYLNAFKNNVITLDHGIKKGEKFHRAIFLEYLATAYNSIKDMENIIIKEFYYKLNQLGFNYKLEYQDNEKSDIDFCERAKKFGGVGGRASFQDVYI